MVKQLGDGTYGNVWKAINRQTNEVVSGFDSHSGQRLLSIPGIACPEQAAVFLSSISGGTADVGSTACNTPVACGTTLWKLGQSVVVGLDHGRIVYARQLTHSSRQIYTMQRSAVWLSQLCGSCA